MCCKLIAPLPLAIRVLRQQGMKTEQGVSKRNGGMPLAVCLIANISKIQFKFKLHSRCAAVAAACAPLAKVAAAEITKMPKGMTAAAQLTKVQLQPRQPLKLWQKSLKALSFPSTPLTRGKSFPILICGCCSAQTPITIKIIIINRFGNRTQQWPKPGDLTGSRYAYAPLSRNPRHRFINQTNIVKPGTPKTKHKLKAITGKNNNNFLDYWRTQKLTN